MVADWSMGLFPDPVSPVVAVTSFRYSVFLFGLATAPEKGKFKVATTRPGARLRLTGFLGAAR
jgi:hypothetical protein